MTQLEAKAALELPFTWGDGPNDAPQWLSITVDYGSFPVWDGMSALHKRYPPCHFCEVDVERHRGLGVGEGWYTVTRVSSSNGLSYTDPVCHTHVRGWLPAGLRDALP